MAAVRPVRENQQQLRPADTTPLRAADFGAGGEIIGRAATEAGQTGQQIAKRVNDTEILYAEIAARDADNQATLERQRLYYEGDNAFFNLQGRNALAQRETLQAERERIDREAIARLTDPLAQDMYRQRAAARQIADNQRIAQHLNTEGERYANSVDEDALRVATNAAANAYDNPAEIMRNIATAREVVARNAIRNGLGVAGSPELEIRQRRAAGAVVTAVANRIERRSPAEARAFIQSMEANIDAETYVRLLDAVEEPAAIEEADEAVVEDLVYAESTPPPAAEGEEAAPAVTQGAARSGADRVMNYVARDKGFHSVPAEVRTLGQASDFALRVNRAGASSSAMGTYQITGETMRDFAPRVFGANWRNQPFTPEAQERLAEAIFNSAKGSAQALSGRWASLTLAEAERVRRMPWSQARVEIARGESGGSVAGSRNRQAIVEGGAEIDMPATIERINARTDLTFAEKQARIAAATRRHSADRQARAEVEETIREQAYTEMNRLGDNFTDYNQLPLATRQQISRFPQIEAQLRGAAATNLAARQRTEEEAARENPRYLDLLELANGDQQERDLFLRQDVRTMPELTYGQRAALIGRQGELRRANERGERALQRPNMPMINQVINTMIARPEAQLSIPGRGHADQERVNRILLQDRVRQRVETEQTRLGRALNRNEVLDIVESEVQPVTTVRRGRLYGETTERTPAYRAGVEAREDPDAYVRTQVDLPAGVPSRDGDQIIEAYRRTHNNGYPTQEEILRIYQSRRR